MSGGPLRRVAARVPGPLVALVALFVLSLVVAGLQLGEDDPRREPPPPDVTAVADDAVLPGEVPAPTPGPAGGAAAPAPPPVSLPEPERLRVPALDLDERLIDLGIAADGTLQVPADPDRVGWFAGGARPGGPGPTVLAAHVDSLEGPAVFARLRELGPGDQVLVDTAAGTAAYVVSGVRSVPRDDFPTAEVFGATERDVVRLITCHGTYDRGGSGYTENLVVTAERA